VSEVAGQVREYVAYCADARAQLEARGGRLDPKCHPTADGAVKMIPHGGDRARAEAIRQAFTDLAPEAIGTDVPRSISKTEPELGIS
jgi:hypothetical protein